MVNARKLKPSEKYNHHVIKFIPTGIYRIAVTSIGVHAVIYHVFYHCKFNGKNIVVLEYGAIS